ncbi:hypothetical protein [Streptomyces angustmyceticus]|uniref:hypothetical protein n=1 Tax=Streptomyces angustmyceticus TaxID=285578 RepID=UPI0037F47BB8
MAVQLSIDSSENRTIASRPTWSCEGGDDHIGVGGLRPDVCASLTQSTAVEFAERMVIERTGNVDRLCDLFPRGAGPAGPGAVFADGSRRWAVASRRRHTASIRLVIVY